MKIIESFGKVGCRLNFLGRPYLAIDLGHGKATVEWHAGDVPDPRRFTALLAAANLQAEITTIWEGAGPKGRKTSATIGGAGGQMVNVPTALALYVYAKILTHFEQALVVLGNETTGQ